MISFMKIICCLILNTKYLINNCYCLATQLKKKLV